LSVVILPFIYIERKQEKDNEGKGHCLISITKWTKRDRIRI